MHVYVCVGVYLPGLMHGGKRTTYRSWFCPSTTWVPGIKFTSIKLGSVHVYLLSHPIAPSRILQKTKTKLPFLILSHKSGCCITKWVLRKILRSKTNKVFIYVILNFGDLDGARPEHIPRKAANTAGLEILRDHSGKRKLWKMKSHNLKIFQNLNQKRDDSCLILFTSKMKERFAKKKPG